MLSILLVLVSYYIGSHEMLEKLEESFLPEPYKHRLKSIIQLKFQAHMTIKWKKSNLEEEDKGKYTVQYPIGYKMTQQKLCRNINHYVTSPNTLTER